MIARAVDDDQGRVQGAAFDGRLVRRLWGYVRGHQHLVWTGLALLILASACRLALPWLVMRAIDEHLSVGDLDGFRWLIAGVVGLAAAEFWIRRAQMYTVERAGQDSLYDLRLAVFRHLQRLSSSFYDKTPIGRLVGRVTTDVEALQEMFSSGAVTILGDFVFLAATVVILLVLQWKLALATFLVVPVLVWVTLTIRLRVRAAYVRMRGKLSHLNQYLHEQISGMPVIQMFVQEERSLGRYRDINAELCRNQLVSVRWESALSALMELFGNLTIALILWYGGRLALGGDGGTGGAATDALTVGALFAFVDYMGRFFHPLNDLSLKYTVMQNAMTASDRIFALLDRTEILPEPAAPVRPERTEGTVRFEGVTFGYDPAEPVLRNVDFEVRAGERVALVGATGAGKTTVLKLLTRLYDVTSGRVTLDGVDVRDYEQRDLRRRIGAVSQDVFLFEGDVLSNVRLGHPEISDEEAQRAADRLHLDEVVARFPGGYREPVRERGKNLSAGEKQLLAFARVLAQEPRVLLLDEATANVDTHTEHLLQEAVHEIMAGRTALIVAHRLSTIRDVDRILVFHRGELVEEGAHDELMARDGVYRKLYELQFKEQEARS